MARVITSTARTTINDKINGCWASPASSLNAIHSSAAVPVNAQSTSSKMIFSVQEIKTVWQNEDVSESFYGR
jgi:hypothetical protein